MLQGTKNISLSEVSKERETDRERERERERERARERERERDSERGPNVVVREHLTSHKYVNLS